MRGNGCSGEGGLRRMWTQMRNAECGVRNAGPREEMQNAECRVKNGGDGARRRYLEQELLEVSAVGIPANPNALTLALKEGAVEKADLQELHRLLAHLIGKAQGERPKAEVADHRSALLRLELELRALKRLL